MPASSGARYLPHLLLTAMIAIWGGSYSVVKAALATWSPFAIVTLRFWLALACLVPFLGRGALAGLRATVQPGLLAGLALTTGYLLQTAGMRETTASMGGFLAGLIVLLVAIGGCAFFGARFGWFSSLGLLLGLAGMAMLCWHGDDGGATVQNTTRGILLQVASSISYAAHVLLLSKYGRELPALPFCTWQLAAVAVAATVAVGVDGRVLADGVTAVAAPTREVWLIGYLGVLATALGIAVQSKVQHRIAPTPLAMLFALQPLFAALVGWLALGDHMAGLQWAGGAALIGALVVTSLERQR